MNYVTLSEEILNMNLGGQVLNLYCILESYCYGKKNCCFPSQATLAAKLNKSIRTIQRYLNILCKKGLISIKRRGSISNLYILLKKPSAESAKTAATIEDKCKFYKNAAKNSKETPESSKEYPENPKKSLINFQETPMNSQKNYKNFNAPKEHTNTAINSINSNNSKNTKKRYVKPNNFNSYSQRQYDFDKLEKALLGVSDYDYQELLCKVNEKN